MVIGVHHSAGKSSFISTFLRPASYVQSEESRFISGGVRDLQTARPAGTHPDTELIGAGGFSSDDKVAGG